MLFSYVGFSGTVSCSSISVFGSAARPSIAPLDVMETTGITLPFPSAAATSQSAEPAPSNVRRI